MPESTCSPAQGFPNQLRTCRRFPLTAIDPIAYTRRIIRGRTRANVIPMLARRARRARQQRRAARPTPRLIRATARAMPADSRRFRHPLPRCFCKIETVKSRDFRYDRAGGNVYLGAIWRTASRYLFAVESCADKFANPMQICNSTRRRVDVRMESISRGLRENLF